MPLVGVSPSRPNTLGGRGGEHWGGIGVGPVGLGSGRILVEEISSATGATKQGRFSVFGGRRKRGCRCGRTEEQRAAEQQAYQRRELVDQILDEHKASRKRVENIAKQYEDFCEGCQKGRVVAMDSA